MRLIFALIVGGVLGFGVALWYQGEPPFAGSATGGGGDITLTLSDRFLAAQAGPAIAARSSGLVRNVRLSSSTGDVAYVEAKGTLHGIALPVGVSFAPKSVNGSIVLNVRSVHLGPLPVPNIVIEPLVTVINNRIASFTGSSQYLVTGAGTTQQGIQIFLTHR